MEIIRDYNQLKLLDKNVTYCCVGFTRPNVFNITHTHIYNHSINKADKLVGILWDNYNDLKIFMGINIEPYEFDEPAAITWFESRGFDYLFIPDHTFITDLLNLPRFQEILTEIDTIWEIENYKSLLGSDFFPSHERWLKLLLARSYFLYNKKEKFLNRTYQTTAPDGTLGYITAHFWSKYCGGEFPLVPILRNENGLAFDIFMNRAFPQEVIDIFVSLLPSFISFKLHRSCSVLEEDLNNVLNADIKRQKYFFHTLDYFCNEMTLNKYVFKFNIRGNFMRDNGKYDIWHLWEYED
jgi:hypothetical protein